MKTIRVRPVLLPTNYVGATLTLYHDGKGKYPKLSTDLNKLQYHTNQQLILISLEDENIEVGIKVACFEDMELTDFIGLSKVEEYYRDNQAWCYDENDKSTEHPLNYQFFVRKVIAQQSQLPPELINQLVREYNNGGMQDFEIEMEDKIALDGHTVIGVEPKLTNGFVTVVEKEYSYNLLCNMQYYMEYCQENGYVTPQEWLKKFKHYTDKKEPILYTEEEVLKLCRGSYFKGRNDEFSNAKNPIAEARLEIIEWFNQNKKK